MVGKRARIGSIPFALLFAAKIGQTGENIATQAIIK